MRVIGVLHVSWAVTKNRFNRTHEARVCVVRLVNGHCQVGSGWGFAGRYAACEQVSRCFQTQAPYTPYSNWILFQSVLRFAVLPDLKLFTTAFFGLIMFQSALRFAVLPDIAAFAVASMITLGLFQSALRFAVLPDPSVVGNRPRI